MPVTHLAIGNFRTDRAHVCVNHLAVLTHPDLSKLLPKIPVVEIGVYG
jgi:hypothetical protein